MVRAVGRHGPLREGSMHRTGRRMTTLYRRWPQWLADRRLLLANRALRCCRATFQREIPVWVDGGLPLAALRFRFAGQLADVLRSVGCTLPLPPAPPLPDAWDKPGQAETAGLTRTARTLAVVRWAADRAWQPVEQALPGNAVFRYDLGLRLLGAAGVDVNEHRHRIAAQLQAHRRGARLDLALALQRLLLAQAAGLLYTWSDAPAWREDYLPKIPPGGTPWPSPTGTAVRFIFCPEGCGCSSPACTVTRDSPGA